MIEIAAQYSFGLEGTARPFLRQGWSHREPDYSWTEGTRSQIILPGEKAGGQIMLEIGLNPLLFLPIVRKQRVVISLNGHEIADEVLLGECTLGIEIPTSATEGAAMMDIVIACPLAAIPVKIGMSPDDRQLGVAVRDILVFRVEPRAPFAPRLRPPLPPDENGFAASVRSLTQLSLADMAACFASLGHNCEFGLAQREMGADLLGLLRFGGLPVRKLIEGLDLGFEGLDEPDNLFTYLSDAALNGDPNLHEYIVRDRRYESDFHTDMTDRNADPESVLKTFRRHLGFLRRLLLEDLQTGHKIFVFQHPVIRSVAQVRPILNVLRSHGPNTLLFVTDDRDQPPGSVEQIEEDLLHGRVSRLAPGEDALNYDFPAWISICANAYRLWRESGRGGAAPG